MGPFFWRGDAFMRLVAGVAGVGIRDDATDGAASDRIDDTETQHIDAQGPPTAFGNDSNGHRAAILIRALEASVAGDSTAVKDLYTSDVKGWSPTLTVSSAAELAVELEDNDAAFTDPELCVYPLDVDGDRACVEWTATVTHSGPVTLDGIVLLEPTGARCLLHGVTVAEFEGDLIRWFRQYSDEAELLTQLGLLPSS